MNNTVLHFRSYFKELPAVRLLKGQWKKQKLMSNKAMDKAISRFCNKPLTESERASLSSDMKEKARRFGFSYTEYFLLQLNGKSDEEVREYISDFEHVEIVEKMNRAKNQAIFDDKALTYKYFGNYYNRDCLFAESSEQGAEKIRLFFKKHGKFILKPVERAGGGGIEIVNNEQAMETSIKKILSHYKYGVFIEELIEQAEELRNLHPQSVNTVRIPTIRVNDKETIIFHPFLRVGKGNAVVDNAGSGGIICALDSETGKVTVARDEYGNNYDVHPDTGIRLIGFQVPHWEEAVNTAKKLAQVIPSNRYTGWDLALTGNGWSMVEGNARGQFVWQYATLQGCRTEIDQLFKKMGLKKREYIKRKWLLKSSAYAADRSIWR